MVSFGNGGRLRRRAWSICGERVFNLSLCFYFLFGYALFASSLVRCGGSGCRLADIHLASGTRRFGGGSGEFLLVCNVTGHTSDSSAEIRSGFIYRSECRGDFRAVVPRRRSKRIKTQVKTKSSRAHRFNAPYSKSNPVYSIHPISCWGYNYMGGLYKLNWYLALSRSSLYMRCIAQRFKSNENETKQMK